MLRCSFFRSYTSGRKKTHVTTMHVIGPRFRRRGEAVVVGATVITHTEVLVGSKNGRVEKERGGVVEVFFAEDARWSDD